MGVVGVDKSFPHVNWRSQSRLAPSNCTLLRPITVSRALHRASRDTPARCPVGADASSARGVMETHVALALGPATSTEYVADTGAEGKKPALAAVADTFTTPHATSTTGSTYAAVGSSRAPLVEYVIAVPATLSAMATASAPSACIPLGGSKAGGGSKATHDDVEGTVTDCPGAQNEFA